MSFQLPPNITSQKERLSFGWAYVFRHTELGQLGRLILQGRPDGQTHMSMEVAGDPQDPMTKKRLEVFKPVGLELMRQLDLATGGDGRIDEIKWIEPPQMPAPAKEKVLTKLMQCEKCQANVALLIFAEMATELGELEDYARIMYPKVAQLNVPAWVIGPMKESDHPMQEPASILKIWPQREPVFRASPDEFNPMIDQLIENHCKEG
ncbi:MAG: hypothetical protein R3B93_18975 [Bacteroidia bacterium]